MFCGNLPSSQPAFRPVDLGIHICGQIFHTGRKANDPLRIGLAVQAYAGTIGADTSGSQFDLDQIFGVKDIEFGVSRFRIDIIQFGDREGNFCHHGIVHGIRSQSSFVCPTGDQGRFSRFDIFGIIDCDDTAISRICIGFINGVSICFRSGTLNRFPSSSQHAVDKRHRGRIFALRVNRIVIAGRGKHKLVILVQLTNSMFCVGISINNRLAIDHFGMDVKPFECVVPSRKSDIDFTRILANLPQCIGNSQIQLNTRPSCVRVFSQHLSRGLVGNEKTIGCGFVLTVVKNHVILIVFLCGLLFRMFEPLIRYINIVSAEVGRQGYLLAQGNFQLSFGGPIKHNGRKATIGSFRCGNCRCLGCLRFLGRNRRRRSGCFRCGRGRGRRLRRSRRFRSGRCFSRRFRSGRCFGSRRRRFRYNRRFGHFFLLCRRRSRIRFRFFSRSRSVCISGGIIQSQCLRLCNGTVFDGNRLLCGIGNSSANR